MASVSGSYAGKQMQTPGIEKMPAKSSFIAEFEYDQANLTLTTYLKSGAIYRHKFVMPGEWVQLQTSQDNSRHWSKAIKSHKWQMVRVKALKAPNAEVKKWGKK